MIIILFGFANEKILVTIKGNIVTFANTQYGAKETSIDGLQLSQQGVIKEHPDLKDNKDWREQAVKRFKKKISELKTEQDRADYIIEDLKEHGYILKKIQRGGFRPKAIN